MSTPKQTLCPLCLPAVKAPLVQKQGVFYTFCQSPSGGEGPHRWADMEQMRTAVAWGRSKYPEFYGADAPPKCDVSVKGPLTVSEDTKEFIEKLAKSFITGESDLKGIVFSAVTSAEESEAEVKRLTGEIAALQRQRPNSSPGRQALAPNEIVLSIPEWAEGIVAEQADSEGKKTAEWVNEQFGAWLDTYFQQTASAR